MNATAQPTENVLPRPVSRRRAIVLGQLPRTPRDKGTPPAAVIAPSGLWGEGSVRTGTALSIPISLAALVVAFVVLQWFVDHKDPKFVEAPARKDDDSVGFE